MAKLKDRTVDALLDNLAEDDSFRARFQKNPREATRSLGTDDPAVEALPETAISMLASKEDFRASRGVVRKQLTESLGPFIPITLDIPLR